MDAWSGGRGFLTLMNSFTRLATLRTVCGGFRTFREYRRTLQLNDANHDGWLGPGRADARFQFAIRVLYTALEGCQ